jgi:hypothetical protein
VLPRLVDQPLQKTTGTASASDPAVLTFVPAVAVETGLEGTRTIGKKASLLCPVQMGIIDAVEGSSARTRVPKMWAPGKAPAIWRSYPMQTVSTIILDIAKSVFQVHGVDVTG